MFNIIFKAMLNLNPNILRKNTKYSVEMDPDSREIPLGLLSACSMNTFVTLQEPTIVMYYHQVLVEFPPQCQSFSENGFHRHFFSSIFINFLSPIWPKGGGRRGAQCASPWHVFAYILANICASLLKT